MICQFTDGQCFYWTLKTYLDVTPAPPLPEDFTGGAAIAMEGGKKFYTLGGAGVSFSGTQNAARFFLGVWSMVNALKYIYHSKL